MTFQQRMFRKGNRTEVATSAREEVDLLWDGWVPESAYLPDRSGKLDPATSIYNLKASNIRRMRAALGAGRSGAGLCRVTFVGDSLTAGMGTTRGADDAVTQLRLELSRRGHLWGEQITPATGGLADSRISGPKLGYSGDEIPEAVIDPGATFTIHGEGSVFEIAATTASGELSVAFDGGAAAVLTTDLGTPDAGFKLATSTALTNGTHTAVLTNTGIRQAFLYSAGFRQPSGIVVTNAGMSGAKVSDWLHNPNWDPIEYGPSWSLFHPGNFDHDVVFIELGMNDRWQSVPVADYRTQLGQLVDQARTRGATVILTVSNSPQDAAVGTTWATYVSAQYDVADSKDIPLLDLTDRWGPYEAYNADGLGRDIAVDGVHLTSAGNTAKAFAWIDILGL